MAARWVGGVVGLGVVGALTAFLFWGATHPQPVQELKMLALPCQTPLQWQAQTPELMRQTDAGWRLLGEAAYLSAQACSPGTLSITAHGELAGTEPPRLLLTLDTEPLRDIALTAEDQTYKIDVPGSGRLNLTYINDYYESVIRAVTIRQVKQDVKGCTQAVQAIDVPAAGGGGWAKASNYGTLVTSEPSAVTLCGAGKLMLDVQGKAAEDVYPILRIEQSGKVLRDVKTAEQKETVTVSVGAATVSLRLLNPLRRELGDRNAVVQTLAFAARLPAPAAP